MRASSWRSEPAAALRGLANGGLPAACWRALSAAKSAMRHVDFAARLEHVAARRAASCGIAAIVRDVGGDVLALVAVAARRRLNELAALVAQRAGEAVDLRLGGHVERRVVAQAEEAAHAGAEFLDLLVGEDVAERQHRHGVADLGEFLRRRRADLAAQRFGVRRAPETPSSSAT